MTPGCGVPPGPYCLHTLPLFLVRNAVSLALSQSSQDKRAASHNPGSEPSVEVFPSILCFPDKKEEAEIIQAFPSHCVLLVALSVEQVVRKQ